MLQSLHSANPESDRERLRVVWTVAAAGFGFGFGFVFAFALFFPRFPASERRSDCAAAAWFRAFVLVSFKAPRFAAAFEGG